jgi:CheY-like chemotaxis protein
VVGWVEGLDPGGKKEGDPHLFSNTERGCRHPMRKQYRAILADDHVLFRHGLRRILDEKPGLEIVSEAGDGLELLGLLNKLFPHLIILDISMPNLRGIEAIPEIRRFHPDIKILILTMHKDEEYLYQAISAGADGYLLKEDAEKELFKAIDPHRARAARGVMASETEGEAAIEQCPHGFNRVEILSGIGNLNFEQVVVGRLLGLVSKVLKW